MHKPSYSTSEAAAFCHVTSDTVRKWTEDGKLFAFKTPGGHRRIPRENLIKFMKEYQIPLPPELREGEYSILIISEDPSFVSQLQRQLEKARAKFSIKVVHDAFDAGRQSVMLAPDITFVDIALQSVNGLELCKRLMNTNQSLPNKLIVVTNELNESLKEEFQNKNTVFLRKSFTPDDLRKVFAFLGIEFV